MRIVLSVVHSHHNYTCTSPFSAEYHPIVAWSPRECCLMHSLTDFSSHACSGAAYFLFSFAIIQINTCIRPAFCIFLIIEMSKSLQFVINRILHLECPTVCHILNCTSVSGVYGEAPSVSNSATAAAICVQKKQHDSIHKPKPKLLDYTHMYVYCPPQAFHTLLHPFQLLALPCFLHLPGRPGGRRPEACSPAVKLLGALPPLA